MFFTSGTVIFILALQFSNRMMKNEKETREKIAFCGDVFNKMLKKNLKNNILLHTFWFPLYVWFGGFNLSCVHTEENDIFL